LPARCSSGPAAQPAVALRQPTPGPSETAPPPCPWRTRQEVRRPPRRPCQTRLPRPLPYLACVPELPRALTLACFAPPPDQAEPRAAGQCAAAAADSSQPPPPRANRCHQRFPRVELNMLCRFPSPEIRRSAAAHGARAGRHACPPPTISPPSSVQGEQPHVFPSLSSPFSPSYQSSPPSRSPAPPPTSAAAPCSRLCLEVEEALGSFAD
jgi:hypothetical protein